MSGKRKNRVVVEMSACTRNSFIENDNYFIKRDELAESSFQRIENFEQ